MVNIRIWMPTYHIGAASRIIRVMPFGFGQQVAGLDSWQFGYINPEDELSLCRYSMSNLPDGTILCLAIKLKSEKFRDSIALLEGKGVDTVAALEILKPLVQYLAKSNTGALGITASLEEQLRQISQRLTKAISPDGNQRKYLVSVIVRIVRSLSSDKIAEIYAAAGKQAEVILSWALRGDRGIVNVNFVLNAESVVNIQPPEQRGDTVTIGFDLLSLLRPVENFDSNIFFSSHALAKNNIANKLEEIKRKKGLSDFVEQNRTVIEEMLFILAYMAKEIDFSSTGVTYKDKKAWRSLKQRSLRELKEYGIYDKYVQLFRRLANLYQKEEDAPYMVADLHQRIKSIWDFIKTNQTLAGQARLRGELNDKNIDSIIELFHEISSSFNNPIFIGRSEDTIVPTYPPLGGDRETGVAIAPRTVYERSLIKERDHPEEDRTIPDHVTAKRNPSPESGQSGNIQG